MHQIRSERAVHQQWLHTVGYVDYRTEPGDQRRLTAKGPATATTRSAPSSTPPGGKTSADRSPTRSHPRSRRERATNNGALAAIGPLPAEGGPIAAVGSTRHWMIQDSRIVDIGGSLSELILRSWP